jgi:hypothetical protein
VFVNKANYIRITDLIVTVTAEKLRYRYQVVHFQNELEVKQERQADSSAKSRL